MVEEAHVHGMNNSKTNLEVLSGMGSPALFPLLGRLDSLDGIQHQILQLQCFNQVCVPHNTWRTEDSLSYLYCHTMAVQIF